MSVQINAHYNVAAPDSFAAGVALKARRKMFDAFIRKTGISAEHSLLDVGVTSDRSFLSSNYIEAWYPHKSSITAVGLDDAGFLESLYPGLRYVKANGLCLPFADGSYDYVHSSAVIEHVGSRGNQVRFIEELVRVSKFGVFFTTPNRWFPIEMHSVLPLVHWMPQKAFRAFLRRLGHHELAEEANLNLLDRNTLRSCCRNISGHVLEIDSIKTFGWPSNMLVYIKPSTS